MQKSPISVNCDSVQNTSRTSGKSVAVYSPTPSLPTTPPCFLTYCNITKIKATTSKSNCYGGSHRWLGNISTFMVAINSIVLPLSLMYLISCDNWLSLILRYLRNNHLNLSK